MKMAHTLMSFLRESSVSMLCQSTLEINIANRCSPDRCALATGSICRASHDSLDDSDRSSQPPRTLITMATSLVL